MYARILNSAGRKVLEHLLLATGSWIRYINISSARRNIIGEKSSGKNIFKFLMTTGSNLKMIIYLNFMMRINIGGTALRFWGM